MHLCLQCLAVLQPLLVRILAAKISLYKARSLAAPVQTRRVALLLGHYRAHPKRLVDPFCCSWIALLRSPQALHHHLCLKRYTKSVTCCVVGAHVALLNAVPASVAACCACCKNVEKKQYLLCLLLLLLTNASCCCAV